MKKLWFISLLLVFFSCKEEPLKYTKEELLSFAQAQDPKVTIILPRSINEGVNSNDYPDGCMSAHIVKVKGLELIAVEFLGEAEAIFAAKKIRGYQLRNWVFDDVSKEPVLEEFIEKKMGARRPN